MDRYLPMAAALLALPHLWSIAASGNAPAAAAARTPRAVSAPVATTAHCTAALPRVHAFIGARARTGAQTGAVALFQPAYLQR